MRNRSKQLTFLQLDLQCLVILAQFCKDKRGFFGKTSIAALILSYFSSKVKLESESNQF